MTESKFSLADLLTLISTLLFGFICFLSINFLTLGDTQKSIILASLIACVLGGLAFGLKILKKSRKNFKAKFIIECFLGIIFLCVAAITIFPFSHYFKIAEQKEDIQKNIIQDIKQARGMFLNYELYVSNREDMYSSDLNLASDINLDDHHYYRHFNSNSDLTMEKSTLMTILNGELLPSNYQSTKNNSLKWLDASQSAISEWKPISIIPVVKNINSNVDKWKTELTTYSKFRARNENDIKGVQDFEYTINMKNLIYRFTSLESPNLLSIVTSLMMFCIMLISYISAKRDSRFPGLKNLFFSSKNAL